MRLKKAKRVLALVMAALMVVGLIPVANWGLKTVKAAGEAKVYSINANDLTLSSGLTESIKAGTDEYFTLNTGVKVTANTKDIADKKFTQRMQSGGAGKAAEKSIVFTTGGAATVTVYAATSGGNKGEVRHVVMCKADETNVGTSPDMAKGADNATSKFSLDITEAGTYYLTADKGGIDIYYIEVSEVPVAEPVVAELNANDLTLSSGLTESIKAGTDEYFTLNTGVKVTANTKDIADKKFTQRMQSGGAGKATEKSIAFTTGGAATVTVYAATSGGNKGEVRHVVMCKADETNVGTSPDMAKGADNATSKFSLDITEAGTYYLTADKGGIDIYYVKVEETGGAAPIVKKPWAEVAVPVIGSISAANGTITVPYTMVIGNDGADTVTITMKDSTGKDISSKIGYVTDSQMEFKPSESGDYTFSISAQRKDETDKVGADVEYKGFVYPLGKSSIGLIYNKGNGTASVEWSAVKEATSYAVEYSADATTWTAVDAADKLTADISGLTVGTEYSFRVVTKRNDETTTSDVVKLKVTGEAQQPWGYIAYGNGASQSNGKVIGNLNEDGKVQLTAGKISQGADGTWSYSGNNGKWVPLENDGLGFYYTTVPASQNFTLRAKVTVDQWILSNGQEAIGLIANDMLGGAGWNNSYSAYISKTEYYWNGTEVTTDTSAQKVTQKLGIGSQEKVGVTKDNLAKIELGDKDTINNEFKPSTYPLEQRYPDAANIIGNGTNVSVSEGVTGITEMYLQIQKNNTGYFVTYESVDGSYKTTKKYYDTKALEQLDADNVYVGFFVSRYGKATFSDVTFTTIDPKDDAPAEERPVEKIAVNTSVQSPTATGNKTYEFAFSANCDGTLSIYDAKGNAVAENVAVKADKAVKPATTELSIGKNNYKLVFTPDANYVPGEYKVMESYEPVEINHTVSYAVYGNAGESLWVAPDAKGNGTKANPMSIYDAVKYVQPGQTIVLMGGTYNLEKTVKVERGINGTEDKKIYMVADPDATERPVLDFGGICAGMVLAGDYWVFRGFDVTNSADAQKGIQVSGDYNLLDSINAYRNGNTGIQISRYLTTDKFEDWPAYNTILNCTSYGNADKGFEDADGFAAKLTIGDGNVFDGCIAHHNADDGWDLFAKAQTGNIGAVTIKNSVAYANGYTEAGADAGNGNGFKMGGSSLSGKHVLQNCVAYDNKAKGIDSNSCPDIIVKDCISYNNGSYNVAFYTNLKAIDTDYSADNVISFRTKLLDKGENIKLQGKQDKNKVYKDTTYYWDATAGKSLNTSGAEATADWFEALDTSVVPTRNADGTINMHGLLKVTDKAPEVMRNAGLTVSTASGSTVVPPSIKAEDIKTGDTTPIALYIVLAVLSLAALAGVAVFSKKKLVK